MNKNWVKRTAIFLGGQTATLFGSSVVQFGISWHVTLSTQSGAMMTISILCGFFPQALISLVAGVWADRYSRKRLIMLADAAIAVCTAALAVLWAWGYTEMWLLFVISAVRSLGAGIQTPAVSAFLPDIVPQDQLMRVNAVNSTIQSVMFLAAPAVAGRLYRNFGLGTVFWVDVATAVIGIGLMLLLRMEKREKGKSEETKARKQILPDMMAGVRYIRQTHWLRQMVWFYLLYMLMFGPVVFLTPLMVVRSFGAEPWRLEMHEIVFSAGSIAGGILLSLWGGFRNKTITLIVSAGAFGLATFVMGFSTDFLFYLTVMGLMGIAMPFVNTSSMTVMQTRIDPDVLGRVLGLVSVIASTAMPLSMIVFGPLADVVSVELQLVVTGLIMVAVALLGLRAKAFIAAGEPLEGE